MRADKLQTTSMYDTTIEQRPTDAELVAHLTSRARMGFPAPQGSAAKSNAEVGKLRARLTLSDPPRESVLFQIKRDLTLGANPQEDGVDVSLERWNGKSLGVSRRHLMLRPAGDKIFVIDLGSTNGTYVNGIQITRGWARPLPTGSLLTLGRLNLWFHLEAITA